MTYALRKTDGTLLITLEVGVQNTSRTSLTLIGKNSSDYGRVQNENFIKLLENFRSISEPQNSLEGQTWYDLSTEQLKLKTSVGFVPLGPFDLTLSTAEINDNSNNAATTAFVHSLFPKGIILLWSGVIGSIPSGWALCDGVTRNGMTIPDLRNKFVMAAGDTYAPNETGGRTTINEVVAHSHNFSVTSSGESTPHSHSGVTAATGDHAHVFPGDDQLSFAQGASGWEANFVGGFNYDARSVYGGAGKLWETTGNGFHSHTFNTSVAVTDHNHVVAGATNSVGGATVDILNTFYALAYIIKIV